MSLSSQKSERLSHILNKTFLIYTKKKKNIHKGFALALDTCLLNSGLAENNYCY